MQFRVASLILTFCGIVGFGASASATMITGGGLTQSIACPSGSSPCSTSADFSLSPPTPAKPATGSITIGAGTASILLTVPTYSMTGSSGPVTALNFSAVSYTASVSITSLNLGGGLVQINQAPGFGTGSVSGTYNQVGGPGSGPFSDATVSFSNLNCLLVNGAGTCGFNVGNFASTADFDLSVNGAAHDVVQSFNVVVPEPATLGLVALGVIALIARRRRALARV